MEKKNYQNFLVSIVVVLIFPLLPIIMELTSRLSCLDTTLALTTALYSVTVLTTSKNRFYFYLSFIPCMVFSGMYVNLLNKEILLNPKTVVDLSNKANITFGQSHDLGIICVTTFAVVTIGFIHGAERYKRHVKEGEPFAEYNQ